MPRESTAPNQYVGLTSDDCEVRADHPLPVSLNDPIVDKYILDLLDQIIVELKITNAHLADITGQPISKEDTR